MLSTRNQYLADILKALGLAETVFWEAISKKEHYAIALYLWIDKLYNKRIPVQVAKCLLFKARNIYYHKKVKQYHGKISKSNF